MTFDQLQYFIEAAKQEHMGRASRILHLSPSALSHAISALESELNQKLFDKKGKSIVLSAAGQAFLPRALLLIEDLKKLQQDFSGKNSFAQKRWNIAASHGLAELLATVWPTAQDLECTLVTLRSAEVLSKILDGSCDFGVCYSPQSHPTVEGRELISGQLRLAVRTGHPLLLRNDKMHINPENLNDFEACLPKSFVGIDVCESHPMLKEHKIIAKSSFLFDSYGVAAERLKNSESWSLLPDFLASRGGLSILPVPATWKAPYSVQMIRLKHRLRSPLEVDLETCLQKLFDSGLPK